MGKPTYEELEDALREFVKIDPEYEPAGYCGVYCFFCKRTYDYHDESSDLIDHWLTCPGVVAKAIISRIDSAKLENAK